MRYFFVILFSCLTVLSFGQQPSDNISLKKIKKEYLEELINKKVNEIRISKSLKALKNDEVLKLTAADQSDYILKSGKIAHDQPNKKKATPFDRVLFYEGLHSEVGENCMQTMLGAKVKVAGQSKRITLKSYDNVAEAIVSAWVAAKESPEVIFNPNYYNVGTSVSVDVKTRKIIATQVYGSEPFILPKDIKAVKDDYKIQPYNREKCADLDKNFPYLPELMSDNIYFKNGEIYFYFHDLELFKAIMKSGNDAIALDVISRDQYKCETGNRFYPSKIHKGVMLPPISKSQLLSKNELKNEGQVELSLGPIPSFVDTNNVEFTLLIIQDNCLCQTIVYNSLGGENLRSLDLGFLVDTLSVSNQADSILNLLTFTVPFERNKSEYKDEDIKPFLDSISLNRYDLKKIEIIAYSSIEGGEKENKLLQDKRAKSILKAIKNYKLQDVETKITTKENWEGFYNSLKGSPYEQELLKLSREEIKKIVNSDTLTYNLEPYLEDQRKAKIYLTVEKIFMDSALYNVLIPRFQKSIKTKDYAKARVYQSLLFNGVKKGKIAVNDVLKIKIPHIKENVVLNNNQIAFRWFYTQVENRDSLNKYLLRDVETQLIVDPANTFLKYNKTLLKLLLWSEKYDRVTDPKYLLKDIKSLYNTDIEPYKVHQLLLNFHIISADFYYETKKFKERDKALTEVKKILLQSQLNRDQVLKIVNYFTFQMRINWAIELMKPWAEKPTIDEDFLFTFLTVAIYNKELVTVKEYEAFMLRAKEMNQKRFCELFGYPNMSFQMLNDLSVKKIYCNTCN
ncbi:MAG: hypothetical protein H6587_00995 [Flavobacteriales bacterium]|nr:hypothetical protein [Flavobacteriales bacterium]MCB9363121.1 hypothetical protein [Flavobacteriales bacterium]